MAQTDSREENADVQGRALTLEATDGYPLGATLFSPVEPASATVVIHGAMAVRQRFYHEFAGYLAKHGFRVLTYDYRGIGRSAPSEMRGMRARISDWARRDAAAIMGWVRQTFPGEPVLFVGHSFGGQLIGILDELRETQGALLVASQLGYYGSWPAPQRLGLAALWYGVVPALVRTTGYLPGQLGFGGVDVPAGVALEWARWCRHPDYLAGYVEGARERFARFDRPTLLFSFSDDTYAPQAAVTHLRRFLRNAPLQHRHIDPYRQLAARPVGHMGFFRRRAGGLLWPEARAFLESVVSGRGVAHGLPTREDSWAEAVAADLAYGRD